jgi:response regulator RpfG family c-di-GMP phosphodiesterase
MRIVLSGYTDLQFITDAINEGAIYKFLTKPWDDEQLREQVREAFRSKAIADENQRLSEALLAANVELTAHIEDKERQAKQIETVLDTLQEVLQLIPWPIVGIDEENMIALSNSAADAQLGQIGAPLLGMDAENALPESLRTCLKQPAAESHTLPERIQLAGIHYRVIFKPMGQHSQSRGSLLALLPFEVSA